MEGVSVETHCCSSTPFGYDCQYMQHALLKGDRVPIPDSTTLHCYHDCHPFAGPPVVDEYVYCSWSCRKAHLKETPCAHNTGMLQKLPMKARAQSGVRSEVKASPPRCCLSIFGGPLSIDQFRAMAHTEEEMVTVPHYLITERIVYELRRPQSDTASFQKMFGLPVPAPLPPMPPPPQARPREPRGNRGPLFAMMTKRKV